MENLVNIFDSFHPGWREKTYVDRFIALLKELILPTYSFLETRIENSQAVFPKEWDRIISGLKEAHFFKLFVPPGIWRRKDL